MAAADFSGSHNQRRVADQFAAKDCQNKFVAGTSIRVEVWEASTLKFTAVYGDGNDAVRINED